MHAFRTSVLKVTYSLAHVECEADVLFFGEKQNKEVITRLTLLDRRIQTDLWGPHKQTKSEIAKKITGTWKMEEGEKSVTGVQTLYKILCECSENY